MLFGIIQVYIVLLSMFLVVRALSGNNETEIETHDGLTTFSRLSFPRPVRGLSSLLWQLPLVCTLWLPSCTWIRGTCSLRFLNIFASCRPTSTSSTSTPSAIGTTFRGGPKVLIRPTSCHQLRPRRQETVKPPSSKNPTNLKQISTASSRSLSSVHWLITMRL